jgi:hypothetical protein
MDNNLLDEFETPHSEPDELQLWQKIIFLIVPIVGLITYFMISQNRPNAKQQAIKFAGIGFLVNVFLRFVV